MIGTEKSCWKRSVGKFLLNTVEIVEGGVVVKRSSFKDQRWKEARHQLIKSGDPPVQIETPALYANGALKAVG